MYCLGPQKGCFLGDGMVGIVDKSGCQIVLVHQENCYTCDLVTHHETFYFAWQYDHPLISENLVIHRIGDENLRCRSVA